MPTFTKWLERFVAKLTIMASSKALAYEIDPRPDANLIQVLLSFSLETGQSRLAVKDGHLTLKTVNINPGIRKEM